MSAITAVRDILAGNSAVPVYVGSRLYYVQAPQSSPLPSIVLHIQSEEDGTRLGGADQYPVFKFIVDCLGGSFGDADETGDAVMATLRDYRGEISGLSIDYILHNDLDEADRGETGDIYRRRLAFVMRYRTIA